MPNTLDLPADTLAERLGGESRIERDVPLAPLTTFKIGGPADLLFRARTPDELANAVLVARELDIPFFMLGLGANILVGDRGFRGLVIRNEVESVEFLEGNRVRAGSGVKVYHDLIQLTVSRGMAGLHHFVGIPSTVGGAIWQNLHFLSPPPERERTVFIEEVTESCRLLTEDGDIREFSREELRFGYDYSILHEHKHVVLDVIFQLEEQPREQMRDTIRENLKWRDDKHPDLWLYPSAGSIFKKIADVGAGRLIDQVGLKGHVYGNAQIFHKHANIIVNLGGACAADVRGLIDLAQTTVQRELGHELHTEIGMVGEF